RVPNKGIGYGVLAGTGGTGFTAVHPDITFNYLGDFGSGVSGADGQELFSFSGEGHGAEISGEMDRWEKLGISGIIAEGRLRLAVSYSAEQYSAARIGRFLSAYERQLEEIINFLSAEHQVHLTPVDLTYKDLSLSAVLVLNNGQKLSDVYPLSPLQEGLYHYWLSNPASSGYFEQMSYRVQGILDLAQLSLAYQELVSRHAVLRTYFSHELADIPVQVVSRELSSLVYIDLSATTAATAATTAATTTTATAEKGEADAVEAFKLSDRSRGFDLHSGSQMRLTVLGLGDDTYEFVWSHHHILMDGWCVGILIKEFFQLYESHLSGKPAILGTVYPYSDYIKWLMVQDQTVSLSYWSEYLSGYETIAGLPKKYLGSAEKDLGLKGYLRRQESVQVGGILSLAIKRLCSELAITENTLIQTAWGILLGNYNNTDDVVFGAVVSGRPAEVTGIEEMIGLFINTIPVRIGFGEGFSVGSVLQSVQQDSIAGTSHHYTQLAGVQSQSGLGRELFDHILVFENYPVQELVSREITEERNALTLLSSAVFEQTGYDLTVLIIPGESLEIRFEYNGHVYEGAMLSRLAAHFLQILELMVTDPSAAIKDLDYLSAAEQVELLETFNATAVSYPKDKTLVDL
ncbi:condensation domain-containing protein, partial [Pedobacter sp. UYP1]|uniref:condensation domain-containing protein n=1 Tax=Pedobacter sp. UYP1 TaxID=1756396 RepID=UPI00339B5BAD